MLRRSVFAAIGLLVAFPRRALGAAPKLKPKLNKKGKLEYRPAFVAKRRVKGEFVTLDEARMDVRRPEGWVTRPAGKDAYAMAKAEPGEHGALFLTHVPSTALMNKAPVGIVLEDVAAKLLRRFGKYRKGSRKLLWETVDMPMAYRRANGRSGRMVARAKTKKGEAVIGYIGVVLERGRIYAVAGFWNESLDDEFLPAADTMFSTMKTR